MTRLNNLITYINLEMTGDTRPYLVSAKQGDKATRYIVAKLLNNGEMYVIPEDAHAVINIKKPDGKHVYNSCEHDTMAITVELTNQILAVAGTAYCDIEIRTEDNTQIITSASFTIEIEEAIRSDKAIKSSNEFTELENKFAEIKDTEKKIKENEEQRVEAENKRKDNEENRISQEEKRQQDTEQSIKKAEKATEDAENAANNCKKAIEAAENFELEAESYAKEAKSWAIGEGEKRDDEIVNNSKYFAEQAKRIVETIGAGGLIPIGTITFNDLPTENVKKGWMYNISNSFISDIRFEDGGGILYAAGVNVYYTAGGKWDVLAGVQVTGVKGDLEVDYRTGNVNITKSNIGLGNVPNVTTDNQVPTFAEASARENIASGEKLSVILGKVKKFFSDLKTVAFTGKYTDLTGTPTMVGVQAGTLNELVEKIMYSPNLRSASGNVKIADGVIANLSSNWYQFIATWQNQYNQDAYDIGLILVLSSSSLTNKWYRVSINGKNGSYTVQKVEYVEFGSDGAVIAKTNLTNNLLANVAGVSALDAVQGKVLDDKISALNDSLTNICSTQYRKNAANYILESGKWMAPTSYILQPGIYILSLYADFSAVNAAGLRSIRLSQGGSAYVPSPQSHVVSANEMIQLSFCTVLKLTEEKSVEFQAYQSSGVDLVLKSFMSHVVKII